MSDEPDSGPTASQLTTLSDFAALIATADRSALGGTPFELFAAAGYQGIKPETRNHHLRALAGHGLVEPTGDKRRHKSGDGGRHHQHTPVLNTIYVLTPAGQARTAEPSGTVESE